jgi:hypothetical protein
VSVEHSQNLPSSARQRLADDASSGKSWGFVFEAIPHNANWAIRDLSHAGLVG